MKLVSGLEDLHIQNCDGDPISSEKFARGQCPMCGECFSIYSKHIRECPAALH